MKPLSVTISAFGSYANETLIDMEALGQNGIYLITGDTGSGKTTIFDAITFSLYGEASGRIREKRMLRSKYAAPKQKTFVKMRFENNGKIYTVTRSPEYERAKERGEGTTKQPSEALLEFSDGRPPITKEKEVTSAIEEIIGLDMKQFSQVAMIAQGSFLKLLLAETKERIEIFRSIFDTDCYKIFQDKISLEAKSLEAEYYALTEKIRLSLKNVHCGEGDAFKERLDAFKASEEIPDVSALSELLSNICRTDFEKLSALEAAGKENENAIGLLNKKLGEAEVIYKARTELEAAKKMYKDEQPRLSLLEEKYKLAAEESSLCGKLSEAIGSKQEKLKSYTTLDGLVSDLKKLENDKNKNQACISKLKTTLAGVLSEISNAKKQLEGHKACKDEKSALDKKALTLSAELSEICDLNKQYSAYLSVLTALKDAICEFDSESSDYKRLKCDYDTKQELFWKNQAGILAHSLIEGKPCPVCGAAVHPCCATLPDNAPNKAELEELENKLNSQKNKLEALSASAANLNGQKENAERLITERAGKCLGSASIENIEGLIDCRLKELNTEFGELKALENKLNIQLEELEWLEEEIPKLEEKKYALSEEIKLAENAAAVFQTKIKVSSLQADELKKSLEFNSRSAAENEINDLISKLNSIKERFEAAKTSYESCKRRTEETQAKISTLEKQLASSQVFDIEELTKEKKRLADEGCKLSELLDTLKLNIANNRKSAMDISEYSKILPKTEEKLISATALSRTVNGTLTGKDRIKFETYVQMTYFEKILARASKRLLKMSDGQYELKRSSEQIKGSQNGLEIEIADHYNGTLRSVKTLSGGEAFKASLSLALAFSDVIQEYSGGISIDALFIDEGFGSLDSESLNQALNALSDLSEGNRLIGIISHVSELKSRIDKKIIVTKAKAGGSKVSFEI